MHCGLFYVTGANKMRAAGGCPYDVPERIVGASAARLKVSFIDWTAANTVFPAAHLILFFFLFFLADKDEPAVRFVALKHSEAVFGKRGQHLRLARVDDAAGDVDAAGL